MHDFVDAWYEWMFAFSWQFALLVIMVTFVVEVLYLLPVSARLRHALWLIVLAKAFLPPSLAAPFGIGTWVIGPWIDAYPGLTGVTDKLEPGTSTSETVPAAGGFLDTVADLLFSTQTWFWVWLIGVFMFWLVVAARYQLLKFQLESARVVDEGPLRVLLERSAQNLGVTDTPYLLVADWLTSPCLLGLRKPVIVLPASFLSRASHPEIAAVLAHELAHVRCRDLWIGRVMMVARGLYWFHPMMWWANRQLRNEREASCDEVVLGERVTSNQAYSEALLATVAAAGGNRMAGGGLIGILERGTNLELRLEQIMNFEPSQRRFGWFWKVAALVTAVILLPMSPLKPDPLIAERPLVVEKAPPTAGYPRVVKTVPEIGATDVATTLKEVRVTFDQRMAGGMSWTGDPPLFPKIDKSGTVGWVDKVTCVLPVELEQGKFYRIGINSKTDRNFRSEEGVPVPPTAVYFVTAGATAEVKAKATKPQVIRFDPPDGATNVDPGRQAISVTFNVSMGAGMSWTGKPADFPDTVQGQRGTWSGDGRTCTLPVKLQPNRHYRLGLNSPSFRSFQAEFGIPLEPVEWKFKTRSP